MVDYYTQRASSGFMITEATTIDPLGVGWVKSAGIWTDDHVEVRRRSPPFLRET